MIKSTHASMTFTDLIQRKRVNVNGIVQGVGFRPFVYQLAHHHGLTGMVANSTRGVRIEIEGISENIHLFLKDLEHKAPPLAVIKNITTIDMPITNGSQFLIQSSIDQGLVETQVSPDAALCSECRQELFDPENRRYRYPFINCTNCGPRYTILENIPYDRSNTSMRQFAMCADCQSEYDDPAGRRFHAQPNCCFKCGPELTLYNGRQEIIARGDNAVNETINQLKNGKIIAVKGLGGFHLAVDASMDSAVQILRKRKRRDEKPFAVMAFDLSTARKICSLDEDEEKALLSAISPIVLAPKKYDLKISELVAPGSDLLGVMLPYTPLHHLLLNEQLRVLVMTSANISDEPICINNQETFTRLDGIADFFLTHNRDIYIRNDDSVLMRMAGHLRIIRRSRGYAPMPLACKKNGQTVLAVGAELKNTICLLKGTNAICSQHIGDLKNLESYTSFEKTIKHLQLLFECKPDLIVHDLHPGYLSSRWAKEQKDIQVQAVQHHHAHLASCLSENNCNEPAIGLIMDGTGYGPDGTIWGGEVLIGDYRDFKRYAHFENMPLPGGDAAIKSPWRTALSFLVNTFEHESLDLDFLNRNDLTPVLEIIEKGFNSPETSSCGRLFDAVAVIAGGRQTINYEAQAAIELMQAAERIASKPYNFAITDENDHKIMSVKAIIREVTKDRLAGESQRKISERFHRTLIDLFTEIACLARADSGIKTVALSGGVFQNQMLFEGLTANLKRENFKVLTHSLLPTNDGGISLGQAIIGRELSQ